MKFSHKKLQRNWTYLTIIVMLGFIAVGAYMVWGNMDRTETEALRYAKYVKDEMKRIVRREVENRIDEIEYDLSKLSEEQRELTREKILLFREILSRSQATTIQDPALRQQEGLMVFEKITSADPSLLYFAISPDGVLLRSGTDNTFEGVNLYNDQDTEGNYYIREMTKAIDHPEGVYVTYFWPKEPGGDPLKKTSYCSYVPELDMIIGVGVYEEDMEAELKARTYSRVQSYYQDSEDYIFVVGYDGIAKVFGNPSIIGQDTRSIQDIKGLSIHQAMMDATEATGEGYVQYYYHKKDQEYVSEKISYIQRMDRWQVYFGMGFHVDDLNQEIASFREVSKAAGIRDTLISLGLWSGVVIVLFAFIRRGFRMQSAFLKQEDVVFEQLFQLSSDGILIVSNKHGVQYSNRAIQKMLGETVNAYIDDDGGLMLAQVDPGVYQIVSPTDRKYFVEINTEATVYHGLDCEIYFVRNITEQYIKSNEMELLALTDQLTGLPNRRRLLNDFEDLQYDSEVSSQTVIAMIDLDNFKDVNDTYGHSFGDKVLQLLAECFSERLRLEDNIYRYGGEEFVAILKHMDAEQGKRVLDQIHEHFQEEVQRQLEISITFSAGATEVLEGEVDFSKVIDRADTLLYKAKDNGKSRVVIE